MEIPDLTRCLASVTIGTIGTVTVFVPSAFVKKRVETWLTVEPETISWLDKYSPGATFIDVGANIGLYSMYAALRGAGRVIAVEPDPGNAFVLNANVWLNDKFSNIVDVYNIPLDEREGLVKYFSNHPLILGHSLNQIGAPLDNPVTATLTSYTKHQIFMMARSLDSIIEGYMPVPAENAVKHEFILKVDVDGIEPKVLAGGSSAFRRRLFSSVLIELDSGVHEHVEAISFLRQNGYDYSPEQVSESQAMIRKASRHFDGMANYIFSPV
jgi:FkbM family methyltransferase